MSPHHALPSLAMLPSPQLVISVGQGLCWLCGTGRMRTLWVWSGAWECPPCSLPKLHFSSRSRLPTTRFPPFVILPSPQLVISVGQGLCWLCGTGRMRMLWVWSGAWECPPCSLPRLYFSSRSRLPTTRFPPFVILPSPQVVSSFGQGLCWLCGTGRMRTLWVWSGAWECPPLCTS